MKTLFVVLAVLLASCRAPATVPAPASPSPPGPRVLVYKTKGDYANLVPVALSADKTGIVAYPHPSDVKIGKAYATPTRLAKGYLLDNRGIGKNVAFLSMTYAGYGALDTLPSLRRLYGLVIDKSPLVELWDCGDKIANGDMRDKLNAAIAANAISGICSALK
jgi:hypothetical protein